MGERMMERETGAGEKRDIETGMGERKIEREREVGRETGVGERERESERETGEKEKKLQTQKNHAILSCRTLLCRTE